MFWMYEQAAAVFSGALFYELSAAAARLFFMHTNLGRRS